MTLTGCITELVKFTGLAELIIVPFAWMAVNAAFTGMNAILTGPTG